MSDHSERGFTRREALLGVGGMAAGAAIASAGAISSAQAAEEGGKAVIKEIDGKKTSTIRLDWKEVYYTNCPLISASNVDQELGWTREEFKKIGVKYAFMRSVPRDRLVPALHPQPGQPDPFRRPVSADPRAGRHSPDADAGADAGAVRRRLHDGARQGRPSTGWLT